MGLPMPEALQGVDDDGPTLPATHATTTLVFDSVLSGLELLPKLCPIFQKQLVYFFYGRMAYRVADDGEADDADALAPVVLVVRSETLDDVRAVYPFDTGGFSIYQTAIAKGAELNKFELGDIATARRLINCYWNSPNSYFWFHTAQLNPTPPIQPHQLYAAMYGNLLRAKGVRGADDRRGTIEISTSSAIKVNRDNLVGMVVPNFFADNPRVRALGAPPVIMVTYPWHGGAVGGYYRKVQDKVFEILVEAKFLQSEPT